MKQQLLPQFLLPHSPQEVLRDEPLIQRRHNHFERMCAARILPVNRRHFLRLTAALMVLSGLSFSALAQSTYTVPSGFSGLLIINATGGAGGNGGAGGGAGGFGGNVVCSLNVVSPTPITSLTLKKMK